MTQDKSKIPKRKDWDFSQSNSCDLTLNELTDRYMADMFRKTLTMFKYENLPDGITDKDMERFTQLDGKQFFLKYENRAYILQGSFTDYITWNREPHEALIVNPALPLLPSKWIIDDDCVLYPNDSIYEGLFPILKKNAIQMASTDISLMFASFNTRFKTLFVADDDEAKRSIDNLIEDIWNGKKAKAIVTDNLYKKSIEGVTYQQGQTSDIKDLIELKQYIKANWYMDLGIDANYNMKREAINESEMSMNDDALLPLIDNMLAVREKAIEKINKKWGYNIKISLNSSWAKLVKEVTNKLKIEDAEASSLESNNDEIKEGDVNDNNETEGN